MSVHACRCPQRYRLPPWLSRQKWVLGKGMEVLCAPREAWGEPGMLNTWGLLFKGRDVQPVFHPEGWEQVVNSLVARPPSFPRSWACSSPSIYRAILPQKLMSTIYPVRASLTNRTHLYGWCHILSFVEFIFTRKLFFFTKLYCCYRTILLYIMNTYYSHGIIKADSQGKNKGRVIKLRIQGGGRSQSRKARWMCHVNKGITTWESVIKEDGLI